MTTRAGRTDIGTQPPVLSVRDLTVDFVSQKRSVPAVRGVGFDVHPNEIHCIVGESGSGKSVTSLTVAGLLPKNARVNGSIRFGGTELRDADAESLRRMRGRDLGFIFQDPATTLNPVLPVGRQITEGQIAHGKLSRSDARNRAIELLREVDIADPEGRVDRYPHEFSGGMRQRAVIAMALAGKPRLIIADEPTTALDVTVQAQVLATLAQRQAELGSAVILITHDLGVVAEVADRVSVMYAGRIIETGPVTKVFERPGHPYTAALLRSLPRVDTGSSRLEPIQGQPPEPGRLPSGCPFHPRCAFGNGREQCSSSEPDLRAFSKTRRTACHFAEELEPVGLPAEATTPGEEGRKRETVLEINDLKVLYPIKTGVLRRTSGWVRAVDGVSLRVHAGETVGLVGESGCGKTTTARAVMGLVSATAGDIRFLDNSIVGLPKGRMHQTRRRMQYVFQDPFSSLNPILTAEEIIAEPLHIHGQFAEMGGEKRVAELFDMVGLPRGMLGNYPKEFSGGQKQRIGIARALALNPKLIILDEPVAALDVSIQAQIVNLLLDLQNELDLGYLFIAHDLSVVRHISDQVAVMYLGKVVEQAARDALYERPLHPYSQSLLSAAPVPDPSARDMRRRIVLTGEIPNPADPPAGCHFHPRCFRATDICRKVAPMLVKRDDRRGALACHHPGPFSADELVTRQAKTPGGVE